MPPFVGLCCVDQVDVFGVVVAADQLIEVEVLLAEGLSGADAKLEVEVCRAEGCSGALKGDAGVSAAKELLRSGVTVLWLAEACRELNRVL